MRTDRAGNRSFKTIKVKVIFPDAIFPDKTFVQHAGPRQGFGPDGIDQILEQVAEQLDTRYPWWNFRPREMRPDGSTIHFVFVFAGTNRNYVPPAPNITPTTESSTPEPAPPEDVTPTAIEQAVGTTLQELASQATVLGE